MKPILPLRTAVTAAALAIGAASAGAQYPQYTNSSLQTIDYTTGQTCYRNTSYQVTSTAVSCPAELTRTGTMEAASSGNLLTRTTRTSARLTDDGTDTTAVLYVQTLDAERNTL